MLNIRLAMQPDLELMLQWRGYSEAMQNAIRRIWTELEQGKNQIFLAFAPDNQLIGTVTLYFQHTDPDLANTSSAYVEALEVHQEYRKQGIAQALMRKLEQYAVQEGFTRLTLMVEPDNTPAVQFYQKMGWQTFKNSTFTWNNKEHITYCLEKILSPNA